MVGMISKESAFDSPHPSFGYFYPVFGKNLLLIFIF